MLGTRDEQIDAEPVERPKFIEDMNESELASAVCIHKLIPFEQSFSFVFSQSNAHVFLYGVAGCAY